MSKPRITFHGNIPVRASLSLPSETVVFLHSGVTTFIVHRPNGKRVVTAQQAGPYQRLYTRLRHHCGERLLLAIAQRTSVRFARPLPSPF